MVAARFEERKGRERKERWGRERKEREGKERKRKGLVLLYAITSWNGTHRSILIKLSLSLYICLLNSTVWYE
jgi:hypothetical protein